MLSFHIKFVQKDGLTTVKQYPHPDLLIREHRKTQNYDHFYTCTDGHRHRERKKQKDKTDAWADRQANSNIPPKNIGFARV